MNFENRNFRGVKSSKSVKNNRSLSKKSRGGAKLSKTSAGEKLK